MSDPDVIGWDIGGAHVKACLLQRGAVVDVAQWACPLWQGIEPLKRALDAARERWPALAAAQHAVTMTGEMVDLFANREAGVRRIAAVMVESLEDGAAPLFFAGDAGWCNADEAAAHWEAIASANWLATARHAAQRFGCGVVIDIGSTTTDLIAFDAGRVLTRSRTDAQRLAGGELVYHGVVRTPLCAIARRIDWCGTPHNVMNEFFATAADVYRLRGELDPAHDLQPSADNAAKDLPATRQRLARMIGLDAREAPNDAWLAFALSWRAAQVIELGGQLRRVLAAHRLGPQAVIVSAGCGDFLVRDVLANAMAVEASFDGTCNSEIAAYGCGISNIAAYGRGISKVEKVAAYGRDVALVAAHARPDRIAVQGWAQVCAPCVAVAALFAGDRR